MRVAAVLLLPHSLFLGFAALLKQNVTESYVAQSRTRVDSPTKNAPTLSAVNLVANELVRDLACMHAMPHMPEKKRRARLELE